MTVTQTVLNDPMLSHVPLRGGRLPPLRLILNRDILWRDILHFRSRPLLRGAADVCQDQNIHCCLGHSIVYMQVSMCPKHIIVISMLHVKTCLACWGRLRSLPQRKCVRHAKIRRHHSGLLHSSLDRMRRGENGDNRWHRAVGRRG